jgi:hypothetical protein
MKIKTEFDINDFNLIKKYLIPNRNFIHVLALLILVFSVFTNQVLVGFIIGVLGVIVMEVLLFVSSKKITKVMKERFEQSLNGKDKLEVDIDFQENSLTSHSHNTESKLTLSYNDLKKLIVSDKYSLLFTTANSFLIIETSIINENDLIEFLLKKNPNIKIR